LSELPGVLVPAELDPAEFIPAEFIPAEFIPAEFIPAAWGFTHPLDCCMAPLALTRSTVDKPRVSGISKVRAAPLGSFKE
jgi:hypothetical protein